MIRRPPRSTRTDTLFPYTTLFRSPVDGVDHDRQFRIRQLGEEFRLSRDGLLADEDGPRGYAGNLAADQPLSGLVGLRHEIRRFARGADVTGPEPAESRQDLCFFGMSQQLGFLGSLARTGDECRSE